jgi:dinuclear metal center YbgI/SA1388 family protein
VPGGQTTYSSSRARGRFRTRFFARNITMLTVADVARFLDEFAPPALAEPWDNVGLLVGRHDEIVRRVMTCLTVTPASAAEAIAGQVELIVSHHPLPFRPLARLTSETTEGRLLLDLIGAGVAIFSPHTAFDSAAAGINRRLADGLKLADVKPLVPAAQSGEGSGRFGVLDRPIALAELAARVKQLLALDRLQAVGKLDAPVRSVGLACGSGGEFLAPAAAAGCEALVTGELRFHACLEAEALSVGVVLAGHFASERFAVAELAGVLAAKFPELEIWASRQEQDPLHWL